MNQLESFHKYATGRFKYFPSEYFMVLKEFSFEQIKPVRVLDFGCGAGNWALAISQYNRNAEVIAIDILDDILKIAEKYKKIFDNNNVKFLKLDYRKSKGYFETNFFDCVFTSSVLQYLNEEFYFNFISGILKTKGRLFLFENHGMSYYIRMAYIEFEKGKLRRACGRLMPIMRGLSFQEISKEKEHAIIYWRTKRIAKKYGIKLEKGEPTFLNGKRLDCQKKHLVFPRMFNIIGRKI